MAIAAGVVFAAILFMHRMAESATIAPVSTPSTESDEEQDTRAHLPPGVEVFEARGPLFFGAAARLSEVLDQIGQPPR
ncbi:hypothetical protein J8J27_33190, partial [Mycobacterium tuberculosis]|nr:hypothetical protein [Mycobacterium tuberculosis]